MSYRRFVVVSSPRSGTHMLHSALRRHRHIVARSEAFNPDLVGHDAYDENTSTGEVFNHHVYSKQPPHVGAVGFLLHRADANIGPWGDIWDLLSADTEIRIIMLHRFDLLRRWLSFELMRERTRRGNRQYRPEPVVVEAENLRREFERYEGELVAFRQLFSRHDRLQISYEDLCHRWPQTLRELQLFLGVPQQVLQPGTEANPNIPLRQFIANYDELAQEFALSRWAHCFPAPGGALTAVARGGVELSSTQAGSPKP